MSTGDDIKTRIERVKEFTPLHALRQEWEQLDENDPRMDICVRCQRKTDLPDGFRSPLCDRCAQGLADHSIDLLPALAADCENLQIEVEAAAIILRKTKDRHADDIGNLQFEHREALNREKERADQAGQERDALKRTLAGFQLELDSCKERRERAQERLSKIEQELDDYRSRHAIPITLKVADMPEIKAVMARWDEEFKRLRAENERLREKLRPCAGPFDEGNVCKVCDLPREIHEGEKGAGQ